MSSRTKLGTAAFLERSDQLGLRTQPTWQLALELSVLKGKLKRVENEMSVLGEEKSGHRSNELKGSILEKMSVIESELEMRKKAKR